MQNYDPNWSRDYFRSAENAFDKLMSSDVEWPAGFQLCVAKYLVADFDSVREIWESLDNWRRYEKGSPEAKQESAIEFRARILRAILDNDSAYIKKLVKAIEAPSVPSQPELSAIRAAVEAFLHLFVRSAAAHSCAPASGI